MSLDKIAPVSFEWDDPQPVEGITAQMVESMDLGSLMTDTITITGAAASTSYTIGTGAGANGSWSNIGSVTLTDPYEEMEKRLAKLEAIIEEEQRIRDECPAVRNAYDEYRFLLVLAKRNNGDLLTDNS